MEDNPILFLESYGLDQLLTDQDDPYLWAAVVDKYWPKLDYPDRPIPRLLFTVDKTHWRFERIGVGSIRPVPIKPEMSGPLYADYSLEVRRPSTSQATVLVMTGSNPAPLAGRGELRIWKRQADGSWIETDEIVGSWIS
jgi:hypothetical protein